MRTSLKRTTVAVLRSILGMKVGEFAELHGCTVHTINSLESGRLKLSEVMAERIFHETGIAPKWLLDDDVSAPPKSARWEPFTREIFVATEANKATQDKQKPHFFAIEFANLAGTLRDILAGANRTGRYRMAHYRIEKFLDQMAGEYGRGESGQAAWLKSRAEMESDFALADDTFAKVEAHLAESREAPAPKPPAKSESPSRSRKRKA